MTVYAETSAVLAWLLREPAGMRVAAFLRPPAIVVTSDLTLVECDRAFHRFVREVPASREVMADLRTRLGAATSRWAIEPMSAEVVRRARAAFPNDAIRALDAIHLATAVVVAASVPDLEVLSLDERIRANAVALGMRVLPD